MDYVSIIQYVFSFVCVFGLHWGKVCIAVAEKYD